jgi:glycosyltransferase involved in cell wall biosynthesis
MGKKPRDTSISIAMCTYNGERFLAEQLESFLRQRQLPDELVVSDDGSQDGTLAILKDFAAKAPFPVRIFLNEPHLGYRQNFEKVTSLCTADIIAFSDQDDVWLPEKLAEIKQAFQENRRLGFAVSDAELVDENLKPVGSSQWERFGFKAPLQQGFAKGDGLRLLTLDLWFQGACLAFASDLRKYVLPFPDHWAHDNWIPLILSALPDMDGKLISKCLIKYRQHPNQVTQRWNDFPFIERIRRELSKRSEWLQASITAWEQAKGRLMIIGAGNNNIGEALAVINDRLAFDNQRLSLSNNIINRLPIVVKLFLSGRYHRFSHNPTKVMIKDICLPHIK